MSLLRYTLFCGAGAALSSIGATMMLARAEGQPALRPINATSHWIWGEAAGRRVRPSLSHTGIGAATNVGAGLFWGGLFGAYLHRRRPSPAKIVQNGAALGAVAGILDYGILPRRLSPGWELALSGRSVILSMAAMAAGAVAGGLAVQAMESAAGAA